jgi:hypothetical protein
MRAQELLHSIWRRARALLGRSRLERDLDDELRFHLAMRAEQQAAAGRGTDEARHAASRRFGNFLALKEECRDMWTFGRLETIVQDARFAGRVLAKNPGFTAVAVLSLALGIGGNAAMFSLVNAVLLRPLPYPAAERLVRLTGFYPKGAVVALQEQSRTLQIAGVGADQGWNLTGQDPAVRLAGSAVSANLFAVLGQNPALGRVFGPGDERPGHDRVVVLSHALWQSRFAGDPGAVGRMILLEGVGREVVGVMPPGFHFPSGSTQLWVPLRLDPGNREDYWGFGWMPLVARLAPGATVVRQVFNNPRRPVHPAEVEAPRPRPQELRVSVRPVHQIDHVLGVVGPREEPDLRLPPREPVEPHVPVAVRVAAGVAGTLAGDAGI